MPADPADREELRRKTGSEEIPALVLQDGSVIAGDADEIIANLNSCYGRPARRAATPRAGQRARRCMNCGWFVRTVSTSLARPFALDEDRRSTRLVVVPCDDVARVLRAFSDLSVVIGDERRTLPAVDAAGQRKIAANEALFREANEGIKRGLWPGEEHQRAPFRCECALGACAETVQLTQAEYEHVRANPRWFVVVGGHELPGAEVVVERRRGYLVVEKVQHGAVVAEELDPRS